MVKVKDLPFLEPKKLPTLQTLNDFGIEFNTAQQHFHKKLNNSALLLEYPLAEFVPDYYEMEFSAFKVKFERLLGCNLSEDGYMVGKDKFMYVD
jgi:hypothetical protein